MVPNVFEIFDDESSQHIDEELHCVQNKYIELQHVDIQKICFALDLSLNAYVDY